MIWQQPWAWLGLLAIVAPIVIHLLGLGRSPTQRFPTLRFFDVTRLAPTRRTQLHDPWLLLLRIAIVAAAVAALAQPFFPSSGRTTAYASSLARVVVLDTSASVRRSGMLDSARRLAAHLINEADVGLVLETSAPSRLLAGATEWLNLQPQRRELVVISDFQRGALDTTLIARVPAATGMQLLRVPGASLQLPIALDYLAGGRLVRALTSRTDSSAIAYTLVQWTTVARIDTASATPVRVLAGDAEDGDVRAATNASTAVGAQLLSLQGSAIARETAQERLVAIVTPGSPRREQLIAAARVPTETWMLEAAAELQSSRVLQDIAADEVARPEAERVTGLVIASSANDQPAVWAAETQIDGRRVLLLVSNTDAAGLTMTSLLAGARSAVAQHLHSSELEVETLSDGTLTRLSRAPATELRSGALAAASSGNSEAESDGRWLWLLALLLLGVEALVRRRVQGRSAVAAAP